MWRNVLKIVQIILLLLAVYLLYTLIQAQELTRSEYRRIRREMAHARPQESAAPAATVSGSEFANAAYFAPDAPVGGELAGVLSSDPPGLNPLISNEASAQMIYSLCTMPLAERDWAQPERFLPALAELWMVAPDKKSFMVRLRRGVSWQSFTDPETGIFHPEKEVTAHDVKFACDVIKDPDVNCAALRSYYQDLERVEVLNDHELIFYWKTRYYGSLSSTLSLTPLPRHFYLDANGKFDGRKFNDDHRRNRMIVGCGAYKFVSWENSRRIVLERSSSYAGTRFNAAPPIPRRTFEIIKLPNTQFQSLAAGKIGMMSMTPEMWQQRTGGAEFAARFRKIRYPGTSYSYIGYNHKRHCFADALTRRALTMLINREMILEKLMGGLGKIAAGPFAPQSVYASPDIQPLPFDPAQAKKLLAQAGWRDADGDGILERDGKKFTFTMLQISGSSTQMKILPLIQNQFAAAGIDMKLQIVEWSVLLDRLKKRDFDACNLGWTGSIDPDPFQIFHSSQSAGDGSNFISFANAELDRKIEELRGEFDLKRRIALCHEIGRIIHDEQPYTFMFYTDALVVLDKKFRNVRVFPQGIYPESFYIQPEALP